MSETKVYVPTISSNRLELDIPSDGIHDVILLTVTNPATNERMTTLVERKLLIINLL